jgi:hypothetical protein
LEQFVKGEKEPGLRSSQLCGFKIAKESQTAASQQDILYFLFSLKNNHVCLHWSFLQEKLVSNK